MAKGNFRINYSLSGEGIEIACSVCGSHSTESEMANKYVNRRIPLQVLEDTPYVCRCGTTFRVDMRDTYWHIFMDIPESLLNEEFLKKITEKEPKN